MVSVECRGVCSRGKASFKRQASLTASSQIPSGGLTLLANLETDVLKLDMELIRGIDTSIRRRVIVATVVDLAERLNIRVVAEGVETTQELEALQMVGIRYVQGYFFATPLLEALPSIHNMQTIKMLAA